MAYNKNSYNKEHIYNEIIEYIKENKIYNYYDFLDYCMDNNEVWFEILIDNPSLKNYF